MPTPRNTDDRDTPTRLLPGRACPPYAHTPGLTPHPLRDPAGHAYGQPIHVVHLDDSTRWQDCEPYLWGIDLFNTGYYWEAHESWESVWIAAGRRGPTADFLKALIKLAAAGVKLREGVPAGARRHLRRAEELLTIVSAESNDSGDRLFGLALLPLRQACRELLAGPLPEIEADHRPVPVLGLRLCPQ